LIQIVAVQKITLERLDDLIHLPFRAIFIAHKVFDAAPAGGTVELAALALVKKFTVLLTHILFILPAIAYLHGPLLDSIRNSSNGGAENNSLLSLLTQVISIWQ
jgi:hypothetical protein